MESSGEGLKAAARKFGVSRSTIQGWRKRRDELRVAARLDPSTPPTDPGELDEAPAAGPPRPPTPRDQGAVEAWDPAECSRREYLEQAIARCSVQIVEATATNHRGVARMWAALERELRGELDDLEREEREAKLRADREANPDAVTLCRRVVGLAPVLARCVPDEVRSLVAALQAALPREA